MMPLYTQYLRVINLVIYHIYNLFRGMNIWIVIPFSCSFNMSVRKMDGNVNKKSQPTMDAVC